jgi:hypothetical protein
MLSFTGKVKSMLRKMISRVAALSIVMAGPACAQSSPPPSSARAPITVGEVNAAQQAWCDGLVGISTAHAEKKDYKSLATAMLSKDYNYDNGVVLFNPTLTFGAQNFRLDKEGAAAYFIGGNPKYPNDKGFALLGWVKCSYTNAGELIEGDIAMTMGNVSVTNASGKVTTVDKFFAFKRGADGKLKIIVHKSSLPNKS